MKHGFWKHWNSWETDKIVSSKITVVKWFLMHLWNLHFSSSTIEITNCTCVNCTSEITEAIKTKSLRIQPDNFNFKLVNFELYKFLSYRRYEFLLSSFMSVCSLVEHTLLRYVLCQMYRGRICEFDDFPCLKIYNEMQRFDTSRHKCKIRQKMKLIILKEDSCLF